MQGESLTEFHISLPESEEFLKADLSKDFMREILREAAFAARSQLCCLGGPMAAGTRTVVWRLQCGIRFSLCVFMDWHLACSKSD